MRRFGHAGLLGAAVFIAAGLGAGLARADVTMGAIVGRVTDAATGEAIAHAVVIGEGRQGDHSTASDQDGAFRLDALPPGRYALAVYWSRLGGLPAGGHIEDVVVSADHTARVDVRLLRAPVAGDATPPPASAPVGAAAIDVASSRVGATFTRDLTENVPAGRDFGSTFGIAPGAFFDDAGVSLAGGSGAENVYTLDGFNVTSVRRGQLGSSLPTDFIQEIAITSAGAGVAYGRSLGGVINVITRSGGNDVRASAFGFWSPYWLAGTPRAVPATTTALTGIIKPDYDVRAGVETGGPVIPDKLFFWGGYAPGFARSHLVRTLGRFRDADRDGAPDPDPASAVGTPAVDALARTRQDAHASAHQYAAKLSYAPEPAHDVSLAVYGTVEARERPRAVNMDPRTSLTQEDARTADVVGRWTSRLRGGRWILEGLGGYHRESASDRSPFADVADENALLWEAGPGAGPSALRFPAFEGDPQLMPCRDDSMTQARDFVNCPLAGYQTGGYGLMEETAAERFAFHVKSTHAFRLPLIPRRLPAAQHRIHYVIGYELDRLDVRRAFSGVDGQRAFVTVTPRGRHVQTLFRAPPGEDPRQPGGALDPRYYRDATAARTQSHNLGAFLETRTAVLPNLTLELGLRWESQQIRDYAGAAPLTIADAWAPRAGLVFDPTDSGRAKLFTHVGRTYQSIPLALSDRLFSGSGIARTTLTGTDATGLTTTGGANALVQPEIRGTYSDQIVLGAQGELPFELVAGVAYVHRRLERVVEAASGPGGSGGDLVVANPGAVPRQVVDNLERSARAKEAAAAAMDATDQQKADAQTARSLADAIAAIARMPPPRRAYDAVSLTVHKHLTRRWLVRGSYTYSRTRGNFAGLYAGDGRPVEPNLTGAYDSAEATLNQDGPLPTDRPHLGRVDGFYEIPLGGGGDGGGNRGSVTIGLSFVARSGTPLSVLGRDASASSGRGQIHLLPRGSAGRTPTVTQLDGHIGYRRRLPGGLRLDLYVDVFNALNQREVLAQDQEYTLSAVNPIVGGDQRDLPFLKDTSGAPAVRNPGFLAPLAYQPPVSGRLGMRLSF